MQVRVIYNITKEYPQMITVKKFKEPKFYVLSEGIKRNRELIDESSYSPKVSSLYRTKSLIKDLVICNDFELFCTFTFDPKKVDSFNYNKCYSSMSGWLHHQRTLSRERGKDFKYLIVPELHKSGRWHFHALISGYTSTLKASGLVTKSLRPIYNITSFRNGFTTAVYIDSSEVVGNYVSKYITKDFIRFFNRKRFQCSRGLIRPRRTLNSSVLSDSLPIFRRCVSETSDSFNFCIDI